MKRQDLTGCVFGKLTVVSYLRTSKTCAIWECLCSCGRMVEVSSQDLKSGNTRSCSCLRVEIESAKRRDITGEVFGRLTVTQFYGISKSAHALWICRCSCGTVKVVGASNLFTGKTTSCGCVQRERSAAAKITHGESGPRSSPEYTAWVGMAARCYNPRTTNYKYWGGSGVTVCDRWRTSFPNFLADVGRRPSKSHSVDRYPNNEGNYEPGNVRWATPDQQCMNRRTAHHISHQQEQQL